jgi:cation diffusion facilitator CzcD-associated flavoprotein CzcO
MELNVWTSATVLKTELNESTKKWTVVIKRADGKERTFHVDHVVYAIGLAGGVPNMPDIPGAVRANRPAPFGTCLNRHYPS